MKCFVHDLKTPDIYAKFYLKKWNLCFIQLLKKEKKRKKNYKLKLIVPEPDVIT